MVLSDHIRKGEYNEFVGVVKRLQKTQVYQLMYSVDRWGYTMIHQCALYNRLEILQFLIDYFKQCCRQLMKSPNQNDPRAKEKIEFIIKDTIKQWVNQFTLQDDGWTALHLSCKPGFKDIFFYIYEKLDGDLKINNKNGVSLMHKASCDDNSYLITYLRDKMNFSISQTDHDGNTPLHYACLTGAEFACFWLLGFGTKVNVANLSKETPLHLLVKSEVQMLNTKTAREMIFKGASRNAINKDGYKPIDLVDEYI